MSEKKILILCQYFYPEYVSSATLPTQLAEDLIANHINVDVMCGWPILNRAIINRFLKPRCIVGFAFTSQVFEV